MTLVQNLITEPLRLRSYGLFLFRLSQMLRERTNGRYDQLYSGLAPLWRPRVALPPSQLLSEEAIRATVADVTRDGTRVMDWRMPTDDVLSLREALFDLPVYTDDCRQLRQVDAQALPLDAPRYNWRIGEVLARPEVQRILADSFMCRIAQEYLGARPALIRMCFWLSPPYPGHYNANDYHYDNDGPKFIKFFIYLTDVDEHNGPHAFIRGSHHAVKPTPVKISRRYDPEELFRYYPREREQVFLAPAGTMIAEDTAGFHRGTPVRSGYRIMLQFEFGLVGIPEEDGSTSGLPAALVPSPEMRRVLGPWCT